MKRTGIAAVVVVAILMLVGCSEGTRPFRQVTFCVNDAAGLEKFGNIVRETSQISQLRLTDNGSETQRGLERIGEDAKNMRPKGPILLLSAYASDGRGLSATNVGLPTHQVVVGFNYGARRSEAVQFSQAVIRRLKENWNVIAVPYDRGAEPLAGCQ